MSHASSLPINKRDRILMHGMVFHSYHGYFDAEQFLGQKFILDCEISTNLKPSGETDDLVNTIDYGDVYKTIKTIFESPKEDGTGKYYLLLETVVDKIVKSIFTKFNLAQEITFRIKKPHVAVVGPVDYLGIEINRSRADYNL